MERFMVGETLQRCRMAFLEEAAAARNILLMGEGHGRFVSELVRINPAARICCVDASARMIAVAKERLSKKGFGRGMLAAGAVRFVARPIGVFETKERFDFIATQFFLDCFESRELEGVVGKLGGLLHPAGQWLICDFQVPRSGWRAARARVALFLAYRFFGM